MNGLIKYVIAFLITLVICLFINILGKPTLLDSSNIIVSISIGLIMTVTYYIGNKIKNKNKSD